MTYALTASLAAHLFFLIAHMALLRRAEAAEVQRDCYRHQCHRLASATRDCVRRDPKTGRYLKTRSN